MPEMVDQIGEQLAITRRPLIIDDFHLLAAKSPSAPNIARDLYKISGAAIMLIGEGSLPKLLAQSEQVNNRQLDWIEAQPASLQDALHLARLYSPDVKIAEDLLAKIHEKSEGSSAWIVQNIDLVAREVESIGKTSVSLAEWGKRELFSGKAQKGR